MPTTTPSFGWPVPVSTDLVKDGATAIESLGDAIDASLVDLKGGTTGQVLAKATGTDMDFTWATPSAGSSNVAGKNGVLNSNLSIWQRGTSVTVSASATVYTADRWMASNSASNTLTVARQNTSDTTNLPFIQYCMRFQRNSGSTGTGALNLSQSMETINSVPFAGKAVSFSFYARSGANYSAASSALGVQLYTGTGTDQNIAGSGYTGFATPINSTATLTTTWQRFTFTGTVAATATEIAPYFTFTPTGTAGANDYFEITGLQLEIAAAASAYSPNAATFQGELAACQRYYWRMGGDAVYQYLGMGTAVSSTETRFVIPNPVQMRIVPTVLDYATLAVYDVGGAAFYAATSVVFASASKNTSGITLNVASGLTTQRPFIAATNNSLNGYLGFGAEL